MRILMFLSILTTIGFIAVIYYEDKEVADLTRRALITRIDDLDQRLYTMEGKYPFFNHTFKEPSMLTKVEDEEFALWAFGDAWHKFLAFDYDATDLLMAWNNLHGDMYRVEETDIISESMETMKELYEETMDKKMHKVTESIKTAEKDIKKGKPQMAVKTLKGAEKKNEKLVKIDKNVRDPIIEKAKKLGKAVKKTKEY